jgi:serine/threonine protein kinase
LSNSTPGGPAQALSSAVAADPSIPQQIGRFSIRERLGAGGFGTVYRAYDPQLEREVALKIPQARALDEEAMQRFLREARAAASLRHPHIVPIYDLGTHGPYQYIAFAFVEGRTLAQIIEEKGVGFRRAAEIVRDLAEALAYAHRMNIVHRDVKPANVLLDSKGEPHLMDFGLASRHNAATRLTREGALLGTPGYIAPEHVQGKSGEALPASDQYSLGIILYELLCGQTPFSGPAEVVLFNALYREPPAPRSLNPDIPLVVVCKSPSEACFPVISRITEAF